MEMKSTVLNIDQVKQSVGEPMCQLLLFCHAWSGCDTTSATFGQGKKKIVRALQESSNLRLVAEKFGRSTKQEISDAGQFIMLTLFGSTATSLNHLRYQQFTAPKYIPLERMAPTSRACHFHSLRVHLQVNTWLHLGTSLDPEEFGYKKDITGLSPVMTDMPPAPEILLKDIKCSCKSTNHICKSCTCSKYGLMCSIFCSCQGNCLNNTPLEDN